MTNERDWRRISSEEVAVVKAIVSASGITEGAQLTDHLEHAVACNSSMWILDVRTPETDPRADLPNGPFPARAFVPNRANYQGEVIIWVNDGHLSGLEYAWVTDDPPTRWPRPDEMEIVAQ